MKSLTSSDPVHGCACATNAAVQRSEPESRESKPHLPSHRRATTPLRQLTGKGWTTSQACPLLQSQRRAAGAETEATSEQRQPTSVGQGRASAPQPPSAQPPAAGRAGVPGHPARCPLGRQSPARTEAGKGGWVGGYHHKDQKRGDASTRPRGGCQVHGGGGVGR